MAESTFRSRYEAVIRLGPPGGPVWPGMEEFGELYDFMFDDVPKLIDFLEKTRIELNE